MVKGSMMQIKTGVICATVFVSAVACDRAPPVESIPTEPAAAAPTPAPAAPQPTGIAYVTVAASARRQPSDQRQIEDAVSHKKSNNVVALLSRGEAVAPLGVEGNWTQVRMSDGGEVWIANQNIVAGENIAIAVTQNLSKTFDRPDLLALNAAQQLQPGTLVFELRTREQFSEVNISGQKSVWVLTQGLSRAPREIDAAKLWAKANALTEKQDPAAAAIVELLKSQFGDTQLVQQLLPTPAPEVTPTPEQAPVAPIANEHL